MRKPFLSSLQRYIGPLALLVFLGLLLAFYQLYWVPARTATLNDRNFRVLASIGADLRHRPPLDSAIRKAGDTGKVRLAYRRLRHLLHEDNLRRREVFTYFFIVEQVPDKFVVAGPTDVALPDSLRMGPWLARAGTPRGGHTADISLEGEDYKLFSLPVRLSEHSTWMLCGAIPAIQFARERRELPPGWSINLLNLTLLLLLALPFLKLALMSDYEQLERSDVARCAAALVVGSGLLLLTAQSIVMRRLADVDLPDGQLTELATATARVLNPEELYYKQWGRVYHQPFAAAPAFSEPPSLYYLHYSLGAALGNRYAPWLPASTTADTVTARLEQRLAGLVLPPGFGVAVIDTTGRLYYQADALLRHSENLRRDCAPSVEVTSALATGQPVAVSVLYQGHYTRLQLRALAQKPYVLAVYFDLRYAASHRFQAWVMALLLLGGYWLLLLLFCVGLRILVRRPDRWPLSRDSLRHFWPNKGYAFRYWQLVAAQLTGLAVLVIAFFYLQPAAQLYLLLVVPVQLYLVTFRFTRLLRASERRPLIWSFGLVSLTLLLASSCYSYCFSTWGPLVFDAVQVLLALALLILFKLGQPTAGQLLKWRAFQNHLQYNWPGRLTHGALAGLVAAGLAGAWLLDDEVSRLVLLRCAFSFLLWGLWFKVVRRPRLPAVPPAMAASARVERTTVVAESATEVVTTTTITTVVAKPAPPAPASAALSLGRRAQRWVILKLTRKSRRAYWLMLTGWVMLLGLVPAQLCYHISLFTERLYEIRHGQLALLQGPWPALIAPAFFFGNHAANADSVRAVTPPPGQLENMRWLAAIHPDTEPLLAAAATLFDPAPSQQRAWRVASLAVAPGSHGAHWLASTDAQHAYQSGSAGAGWLHRLLPYLPLALLSISLLLLVDYLTDKIFASPLAPPAHLPPLALARQLENLPHSSKPSYYWLLPGSSDWLDVPDWTKSVFLGVTVQPAAVFDCRQLFSYLGQQATASTLPEPTSLFKKLLAGRGLPENQDTPLVFTHFDYRHAEPGITDQKSQLLASLLLTGRPLVLVASMHPAGFGEGARPASQPPEAGPQPAGSGERLLDLLGDFRLQYFSLSWRLLEEPFATQPRPSPHVKKLALAPGQRTLYRWRATESEAVENALFGTAAANLPGRQHFETECQAFPFVQALRTDILGALWRQRTIAAPLFHAKTERELARHRQHTTEREIAETFSPNPPPSADRLARMKLHKARKMATQLSKDNSYHAQHHAAHTTQQERDTNEELGRWEMPKPEPVADTIRRVAWLHFRRLWRTLSPQEHFLLFDLAYDGLVNTNNRHHLHNLLHKGLLRQDAYGRLHVASQAFQDYIIAEQRRPEALRYAEQAPNDLWAVVQPSLILLTTIAALFIVVTQPGPLLNPQRILALLVALVPQLNFLLKIPTPPTPPAS